MTAEDFIEREYRKCGMSLAELCRKSGADYRKVTRAINGHEKIRADDYLDICEFLHIDPMEPRR